MRKVREALMMRRTFHFLRYDIRCLVYGEEGSTCKASICLHLWISIYESGSLGQNNSLVLFGHLSFRGMNGTSYDSEYMPSSYTYSSNITPGF